MMLAPRAESEGWSLTCVEPDPNMAELLRFKLSSHPELEATVVVGGFERFSKEASGFSLLYAAQSWHWVEPSERGPAAARVLEPGGTVALVWNVARPHGGSLKKDLDAVYSAYGLASTHPTRPAASSSRPRPQPLTIALDDAAFRAYVAELKATGLFSDYSIEAVAWSETYDTDEWITLLETHSDHRMLEPVGRGRLLEEVRGVVDAHGGVVEVSYDAVAILACRGRPDA